jgi:hypothetical protein
MRALTNEATSAPNAQASARTAAEGQASGGGRIRRAPRSDTGRAVQLTGQRSTPSRLRFEGRKRCIGQTRLIVRILTSRLKRANFVVM